MSAPYSAASGSSISASAEPGCASPGTAKPTRGVATSSPSAGPASPATRTSATSGATARPSTSSPEDRPASPSPSPGKGSPRMTSGGFGPSTSEPFASFDPDTRSWRTPQLSLLEDSETFSGSWPRSGMTRSGSAFRLPHSVPPTAGTARSSLPTPTKQSYGSNQGGGAGREGQDPRPSLETMASTGMFPTPTAAPWTHGGSGEELQKATAGLLPRPTRADSRGSRNATAGRRPDSTGHSGTTLSDWAWTTGGPSGRLNPAFVAWLMGAPEWWVDPTCSEPWETALSSPSDSGSESD